MGAILYISNYFFGLNKYKEVKYLIIDEMQDYSFATYSVLNSIFNCNKTILGDINQCIEKVMTIDDLKKLEEILNCELINMNKTFRSTYEIMEFASKIKGLSFDCFDRHGEKPQIINVSDYNSQVKNIIETNKSYNSIALLTKNAEEAKKLYQELYDIDDISLNISYDEQMSKVCIMPSYMAKGLEFDIVIIPNYNKSNYCKTIDLNMLYVSSTRALHKLYLLKK